MSYQRLHRRCVGGGPLRRYARLVGAPNYAPSLRSVAGLLHALALQAPQEDLLRLPTESVADSGSRSRPGRTVLPALLCAGWYRQPQVGRDSLEREKQLAHSPGAPRRRCRAADFRRRPLQICAGRRGFLGGACKASDQRRRASERSERALLAAPRERA